MGLRGNMPVLIRNFLHNRLIRVRVGTFISQDHSLSEGFPQGSVLSVAINGLITNLPEGVLPTLYVDDLSISFAAARMTTAERRLQLTIDRISAYTEEREFRLSIVKTAAVHRS